MNLEGPAEKAELRLYSVGRSLIFKVESGPLAKGWSALAIPAEAIQALPAGSCHYRVQAWRGGEKSEPRVGTLVFLP